jgi:hypothetical protein
MSTPTPELAFARLEQLLLASGARVSTRLRPITFFLTDCNDAVWSFDARSPTDMIAPVEHKRPAAVLFLTSKSLLDLVFSRGGGAEPWEVAFQGDLDAIVALFDSLRTPRSAISCRIAGATK